MPPGKKARYKPYLDTKPPSFDTRLNLYEANRNRALADIEHRKRESEVDTHYPTYTGPLKFKWLSDGPRPLGMGDREYRAQLKREAKLKEMVAKLDSEKDGFIVRTFFNEDGKPVRDKEFLKKLDTRYQPRMSMPSDYRQDVVMCITDIEGVTDERTQLPEWFIHGRMDDEGIARRAVIHVTGWRPWMYVTIPEGVNVETMKDLLYIELNCMVSRSLNSRPSARNGNDRVALAFGERWERKQLTQRSYLRALEAYEVGGVFPNIYEDADMNPVCRVSGEMKEPLYIKKLPPFTENMLYVQYGHPALKNAVADALRNLHNKFPAEFPCQLYEFHECDILKPSQMFMTDTGEHSLASGRWIRLPLNRTRFLQSHPRHVSYRDYIRANPVMKQRPRGVCAVSMECKIDVRDIITLDDVEGEYSKQPNIVIITIDIEVPCQEKGEFPQEPRDPVNQCSFVITTLGNMKVLDERVVVVGTTTAVNNCYIEQCSDERRLLRRICELILEIDPDVIMTYNGNQFDFGYLFARDMHLRSLEGDDADPPLLSTLGPHLKSRTSGCMVTRFQSNARGLIESIRLHIPGCWSMDLYEIIKNDYRYPMYTLNYVAFRNLGERKIDIHHSHVNHMQNAGPETRARIADYCRWDSALLPRIADKLKILQNYISMARVCSVLVPTLYINGQGYKFISTSTVRAHRRNMVLSERPPRLISGTYKGATVVEPDLGFYVNRIVGCVDFASLYPTIMIAHNICPSTLIPPHLVDAFVKKYGEDAVTRPPYLQLDEIKRARQSMEKKGQRFLGIKNMDKMLDSDSEGEEDDEEVDYEDINIQVRNAVFVKKHIREGLGPQNLAMFLSERKKTRKMQRQFEKGSSLYNVLEGRQLALKMSANSGYGALGTPTGKIACLEAAAAVTTFGRYYIEKTQEYVNAYNTREKILDALFERYTHPPLRKKLMDMWDREVKERFPVPDLKPPDWKDPMHVRGIYGDTDSVMIETFGRDDFVELSCAIIIAINERCNRDLFSHLRPIELEFEKVYVRYLLIKKKRYAGIMVEAKEIMEKETGVITHFELEYKNVAMPPDPMYKGPKLPVFDYKGIELKRRDTFPALQTFQFWVIHKLVIDNDIQGAFEYAKSEMERLWTGKIPMSALVFSKGYQKKLSDYAAVGKRTKSGKTVKPPTHVAFVEMLNKRNPTDPVRVGDRVQYVMICAGNKASAAEEVEDPFYAQFHGIPLNYARYAERMLKCVWRFFNLVLTPAQMKELYESGGTMRRVRRVSRIALLHEGKEVDKHIHPSIMDNDTMKRYITKAPRVNSGNVDNAGAKRQKTKAAGGDAKRVAGEQFKMTAFFRPAVICLGCKKPLKGDTGMKLCSACSEGDERLRKTERKRIDVMYEERKVYYDQLQETWKGCVDCGNRNHQDPAECDTKSCPKLLDRVVQYYNIVEIDHTLCETNRVKPPRVEDYSLDW